MSFVQKGGSFVNEGPPFSLEDEDPPPSFGPTKTPPLRLREKGGSFVVILDLRDTHTKTHTTSSTTLTNTPLPMIISLGAHWFAFCHAHFSSISLVLSISHKRRTPLFTYTPTLDTHKKRGVLRLTKDPPNEQPPFFTHSLIYK